MKVFRTIVFLVSLLVFSGVAFAQMENKEWAKAKKEYKKLSRSPKFEDQKKSVDILVRADRKDSAKMLLGIIGSPPLDFSKKVAEMNATSNSKNVPTSADSPETMAKKQKAAEENMRAVAKLNNMQIERERLREYAMESLKKLRSDEAMKVIIKGLKSRGNDVKKACVAALGYQQDEQFIDPLDKCMKASKSSPEVRIEICRAYKSMASMAVVEKLEKVIKDDRVWQVRFSAAEAIVELKAYKSIKPMIDRLHKESGRIKKEWEELMHALVGVNYHGLDNNWDKWWERNQAKVLAGEYIPPESRKVEAEAERKSSAKFFDIPVESDNVMFIIDTSGSMRQPLGMAGGPEVTGGAKEDPVPEVTGLTRLDEAKRQLIRVIRKLPPKARFNIITYNTKVEMLNRSMLQANPANVNMMVQKIVKLVPDGQTNLWDSMELALNLAGVGATDKQYQVAVDTIFILNDGQPNYGRIVDPYQMLEQLARMNRYKRIVIHCVEITRNPSGLMEAIAKQNGGVYKLVQG